mgnify:CR=1 FL=1
MNKQLLYNKLFNKPTKLKSKKVNLSAFDDLKSQWKSEKTYIDQTFDEAINLAGQLSSKINQLMEFDFSTSEAWDMYQALENQLEELGLELPSDVDLYTSGIYIVLQYIEDNAVDLESDFYEVQNRLENFSNKIKNIEA